MKKRLILCLICVLILFIFGCGSVQTVNNIENSLNEEIEEDLYQRIIDENGNILEFILVHSFDDETKNISVHINSKVDYAYLGDYIKSISSICSDYMKETDAIFDRLSISINRNEGLAFAFDTNDFESGTLIDYRSGEGEITRLETLDDLQILFPVMKLTNAQSKLPDGVTQIYNEVLEELNAHPTFTEDSVFEHMAPNYSMTPYELNAFFAHYMGAMYGEEYTPLPDDYGFTYIEAPESIYTTTGKDNGLMDTAMYATGKIKKLSSIDKFEYFVLENDYGKILIAQDKILDRIGNSERWGSLKVGDWITVYFVYLGWLEDDFYTGANGIYFTCLYDGEDLAAHKKWIQRWYNDYISK